jgi:hypothetical protein
MRPQVLAALVTAAVLSLGAAIDCAAGSEFWYGCRSRPACGKVCRLVCEEQEIKSICYACECDEICIPWKSKRGCKHCETACCADQCAECTGGAAAGCDHCGHTPKCEFCWRDWIPCGCAKPRKIKVLTKYEAVKKICWYHWEVVDAAGCGCAEGCDGSCDASCGACACTGADGKPATSRCIYKPAPEDAEIGAVMALSDDERVELVAFMNGAAGNSEPAVGVVQAAPTERRAESATAPKPTAMERLAAAVGWSWR